MPSDARTRGFAGSAAGWSAAARAVPRAASTRGLPGTSLIICTRDRPQLLFESVRSVLTGDEVPSELLIMDQSPKPVALPIEQLPDRECAINWMHVDVAGECPARNIGIAAAAHDLLVFTDDDVLVTTNWFGELVRAQIAVGSRAVVTGQVFPSSEQDRAGFVPTQHVEARPMRYRGRIEADVLFPMNMALYRSAFDTVGLFDERFGAGGVYRGAEDNDLGFRLLEAGFVIHHIPAAIVYHRAWRPMHQYSQLRWNYGYCQGAFYAKHLRIDDRYMARRMVADIRRKLVRFPRRIARREFQWLVHDLIWLGGLLSGATRFLVRERLLKRASRG